MTNDIDETADFRIPKHGRGALPWVLVLVAVLAAGLFFWKVHRPLAEDVLRKDATIADLTKQAADARRAADDAKAAQANLEKAQVDLKQARDDLARTAAQRADDEKLLEQLKKQAGAGGAEVEGAGGQIRVTMVDRILFKSGEAVLTPQGEDMLRRLGDVFKGTDKLIEVCGHADNQPVESAVKQLYPTNWELSTGRATNVVRFLEDKVWIKPRRLKAAGFGAARPIASNAKPAGRAKNRRIEILLLPDNLKVVKGDFSDEIASAAPATKKAAPAKSAPPRATERVRPKAVAVVRAKHRAKHHSK